MVKRSGKMNVNLTLGSMAISAHRFNIKPVRFIIAIVVVILVSLIATDNASLSRNMREFTISSSIIYSPSSFDFIGMSFFVPFGAFPFGLLSLFFLAVVFSLFFVLFRSKVRPYFVTCFLAVCFLVYAISSILMINGIGGIMTHFAGTSIAVLITTFWKVCYWFPFLALGALLKIVHFTYQIKHPQRLVVRCYHTSRRPPGVRFDNSTSGFIEQLFCLCGKGNYSRFGTVWQW